MTATVDLSPPTSSPRSARHALPVARPRSQASQDAARLAAAQPAPRRRQNRPSGNDPVQWLPRATEFSTHHDLVDPTELVRTFRRSCPELCAQLIADTTPQRDPSLGGRPRLEGSWALVFLGHVLTGDPDWEPFYTAHRASGLWQACGFAGVPAWNTMRDRFIELEQPRYRAAFQRAAEQLIRVARHFEPRIGRTVDVDSTAAHSHSKLEHACPSRPCCERHSGRDGQPGAPVARELSKVSDDEVRSDRHRSSRMPEQEAALEGNPGEELTGHERGWRANKLYKLPDELAEQLGLDVDRYRWYFLNGHFLRCRDRSAGVRMYQPRNATRRSRKRVWVGAYMSAAVDHFTGAPLAVNFFAADINEVNGHPELMRRLKRALGELPAEAVYDAGYSVEPIYRENTLNGVATVAPTRDQRAHRDFTGLRTRLVDEHGMTRCRYCGGITHQDGPQLGFSITGTGDPRIRFRCQYPWTDECRDRIQTISCSKSWRLLTPLNRLQPRFHSLLEHHSNYERVFKDWRQRYAVAGNNVTNRSKRVDSVDAQQLRAAAAMLAEWLRVCLLHGWVGNHARLNPSRAETFERSRLPLAKVNAHRRQEGLDLPYGPAAERFGITGRSQDPLMPNEPTSDELPF